MKRVFVLGLDAMSPKLVERFARDGTCPNLRRIMENGSFSKVLPVIPAQTPENWTTIATGANPGTHGIAIWGRHSYGESVAERHGDEAMSSNLCKAEYLWEAAARKGLRSVVHYFVGYPQTSKMAVHVDWFWRPGAYFFEICGNACYIYDSQGTSEAKRPRGILVPIELSKAEDWANLPENGSMALETEIHVIPKVSGEGVSYFALLLNTDNEGYRSCILSKEKDYSKAICSLREGEWSPWLKETFRVKGEKRIGTVRFKLVKLLKDAGKMTLYRSQVYPVSGFTDPPEVAEELIEKFGPYVNEAVDRPFLNNLIDEETFVEEFEYQINWIARAAKYLMDKNAASLYMMHWHYLDSLEHVILGLVDPVGGMFAPENAEKAWRTLKLGYRLADELVGEFLKYVDEETYLVVVSDHGNAPNRKRCSIVNGLAEKGLVTVEETNGAKRINWAKSKVYIDLTSIYVNLRSKYAGGIVEDSEYEKTRIETIDTLRSCKDQDGEYVVAFAFKREEAPMIGLWGEHVGDIVFAYSSGFTWGTNLQDGGSVKVGGANHGPQLPTTETEISSNYATFMMIGKDIKKRYIRPVDKMGPVQQVDLAPTVSHILNMRPPRHCQGRILHDFFEGWDISDMKREWTHLKFPRKEPLVGDVTDTKIKA